jgi:hypothetical protein
MHTNTSPNNNRRMTMKTITTYTELTELELDIVTGGETPDAGASPDAAPAPAPKGGGAKPDAGASTPATKKVELGLEAELKKDGDKTVKGVKATVKGSIEWK